MRFLRLQGLLILDTIGYSQVKGADYVRKSGKITKQNKMETTCMLDCCGEVQIRLLSLE